MLYFNTNVGATLKERVCATIQPRRVLKGFVENRDCVTTRPVLFSNWMAAVPVYS